MLVLQAIQGADGKDLTVHGGAPLHWDPKKMSLSKLKIGVVKADFERTGGGGCPPVPFLLLDLLLDGHLLQVAFPAGSAPDELTLSAGVSEVGRHGGRDGGERAVPAIAAGGRIRFWI